MQDLLSPTSRQRHIQLSTIVLHICPQIGPQCRCYSSQSGGPAKAHLCSLATLKVCQCIRCHCTTSSSLLPCNSEGCISCYCISNCLMVASAFLKCRSLNLLLWMFARFVQIPLIEFQKACWLCFSCWPQCYFECSTSGFESCVQQSGAPEKLFTSYNVTS